MRGRSSEIDFITYLLSSFYILSSKLYSSVAVAIFCDFELPELKKVGGRMLLNRVLLGLKVDLLDIELSTDSFIESSFVYCSSKIKERCGSAT